MEFPTRPLPQGEFERLKKAPSLGLRDCNLLSMSSLTHAQIENLFADYETRAEARYPVAAVLRECRGSHPETIKRLLLEATDSEAEIAGFSLWLLGSIAQGYNTSANAMPLQANVVATLQQAVRRTGINDFFAYGDTHVVGSVGEAARQALQNFPSSR